MNSRSKGFFVDKNGFPRLNEILSSFECRFDASSSSDSISEFTGVDVGTLLICALNSCAPTDSIDDES